MIPTAIWTGSILSREQAWADAVILLRAGGGGEAWQTTNAGYAFGVSELLASTFAHELGHLMGLVHDRHVECDSNSCNRGSTKYGYGYVNQQAFESGAATNTRWRTIMSYNDQCFAAGFSCGDILRFSNPNQTYRSDPLGVASTSSNANSIAVGGPADAARTLNETRENVAENRQGRPVKVSFAAATYTATEGGATAQVKVQLDAKAGRRVSIPLRVATTDARSGDYTVSARYAPIPETLAEPAVTVTVTAVDDSVDENAETLTLSFGDLPGGVTAGSQASTTVTLADNDTVSGAPGIETVSITSNAGSDGIYVVDEEIEVTVVFDKIVAVTGTPRLGLTMDSGSARPAEYSAGAGEVLVFTYAVADGDSAASGFGIAADSLTLNGGTILDATDTGSNQAADLTHAALAAASGHVVDGRRPALQTAGVDGFVVRLTYDETLDATSTPAKTAFTVTADGAGLSVESVALAGAVATLRLGAQAGSGQTVQLDYIPPGTSPLRDPVGNAAVALSDRAVTNTTPEAVYDEDADGLIAITTLAQLDAIRHDPDGDGAPTGAGATAYAAAFPDARRVVCGVGSGCRGYELLADLDFLDSNGDGQVDAADDTNGDGRVDAEDTAYWNDGAGWAPIGAVEYHEFRTTFAGHGHTIRHLFVDRLRSSQSPRHVGLFGRMEPPGVIRHVGLTDVEVTGNWYVGGLVGTNDGVITGSWVAGRVTGTGKDTGGLVGRNTRTIHASYATGRVVGNESAGGLVGRNSGTIRASYATGQVVGRSQHAQYIGSLVGRMTGGSILASYATGRTRTGSSHVGGLVGQRQGGSITDSYWDTRTSGHATGGGGAGKTTTDLQTPTGYTAGGIYEDWNVDLSGDSTADDPWHFGTAGQYPALKVDFNGDKAATWQEFGYQMRAGPTTPTATATAGQVALSWTAAAANHWTPSPAVTYTVYRDTGTTAEVVAEDVGGTTYTDTEVAGGTAYAYQVAAVVGGGEATWSGPQTVTTVNSTPVFANSEETRSVAEDAAAGTDVGAAVTATDTDNGDTLSYSLEGTDAGSFDIVAESGQIQTRSGVTLDHETRSSYSVTVKAEDGNGGSATVAVMITVTDADEQPQTPAAPTVAPTANTTDSLDVGWTAPGLNGGPALTGYEVQYRKETGASWTDLSHSGTGTSTTIGSLEMHSIYEVQVRALNGETPSDWSPSGRGSPGNNLPVFDDGSAAARSVAENAAAETNVGAAVAATDADNDTLSYSLEGADAGSFEIVAESGQIRTTSGVTYDHETQSSYSVAVKAVDANGSATVPVTIAVTDVDEPPAAPAAPAVAATAGTTDSLDVSWTAPDNTGPEITDYDVRYGVEDSGSWSELDHAGTGLSATITGLAAATTYAVQVRATNAEGTGAWSDSGTGRPPLVAPFVSNLAESNPTGTAIQDAVRLATAFTTGSYPGGYAIDNVSLQLVRSASHPADSTIAVTVRGDSAGTPGDILITLTQPEVTLDLLAATTVAFTAPAGSTLAPETTYFLVAAADSGAADVLRTDSDSDVSGFGWSIADGSRYAATGADWADTTYSLSMAVEGGLAPPVLSALAPSGLAGGDSFRLLFATSGIETAVPADIADYNRFVQNIAAAGHADIKAYSSLFTVVGSTASVDARDNTGTTYTDDDKGVPIYWLGGGKVADDYEDFYDGDWDDEANATDEHGQPRALAGGAEPYTGSKHDGTADTDHVLGSTSGVRVGAPNDGGTGSGPLTSMLNRTYTSPHPFYALSPVFVVEPVSVSRSWSLAPTGVVAGDSFRLLFATRDMRPAASTDIAEYNTFVQTAAANGHPDIRDYSSLFAVVGSTASVDARDNTATGYTDDDKGVPIYWLGGNKVADDYEDFYDGSWDDEASPKDASGASRELTLPGTNPFTGSEHDGTKASQNALGTEHAQVIVGRPNSMSALHGPIGSDSRADKTSSRPFYALSRPLVVVDYPPVFGEGAGTVRSVPENAARETDVGAAVTATDADQGETLAYSLGGDDAGSFDIDSATGQIKTKSGVTLDHETKSSYSVTVKADDGHGRSATIMVTITVTDVAEQPETPGAPTVTATAGTTDSLDVAWTAPGLNGGPALTGYKLRHRKGAATWTELDTGATSTAATVGALDAGSSYDVQVQALNGETPSAWSSSGTGSTGPPAVTNAAPVFGDTAPAMRSVAENTAAGENVGAAVAATDDDAGDTLTYSLGGTDAASFDIVTTSGQLRTRPGATYDHEAKDSYAVDVSVTDGTATVTLVVTVTVTDVAEQPATPAAPTVAATAGTTTSLDVSWTAPHRNGGPALTGYNLQYRQDGGSWTAATHSGTGTTATITGLAAGTAHEVQVRALNGETPSAWSASGTGTTAAAPATEVPSDWALVPSGLGTGDSFRLLFVTYAGEDPDSADIADHNTYVQSQANANNAHAAIRSYNSHFRVVGSTASTDARDNTATTGTGVPIHWLNGSRVADDYADFYDGSWDDEANPRERTGALATATVDRVWTGSTGDGQEKFNSSDVSRAFGAGGGAGLVGVGRLGSSSDGPLDSDESYTPNTDYRYYALSGVFVVGMQAANSAPVFSDTAPAARSVAENTAAGENVGTPVAATDTDIGDTLTYSLGGTNAASFDIVSASGQIRTGSGATYDHEAKGSYAVEVSVTDGTETVSIAVTVTVTDVAEQPATPAAPTVTATAGTTDSLDVGWTAPGLNGGPALTGYKLEPPQGQPEPGRRWTHGARRARPRRSGRWTRAAAYDVQVQALNGETPSAWSDSGTGTTGSDTATAILLSVSPESVAEDAGGTTVTVTAELDGVARTTATTVTVSDATTGTATSGTDYAAVGNFAVTIAANQTSGTATFSFTPTDDSDAEEDETVVLSGSATGLESGTATLTIDDDDGDSVIDVAVFYTAAAKNAEGGTAQIKAEIDMFVTATNMAYGNSGVDQRINLVWAGEVVYTETSSISTDLDRLTDDSDGYMDGVHAIREQVWADAVILFRAQLGGVAHAMDTVATTFAPDAFGVADLADLTFAHELGHIMGLYHDRHVSCGGGECDGSSPYAYGYVNQEAFVSGAADSTRWRTIMAYDRQCTDIDLSCDWILRFSNPDQTWLGDALGVALTTSNANSLAVDGPADAVRRLNESRETVAEFRRGRAVEVSFAAATYTATEGGAAAQVKVQFDAAAGRSLDIPLVVATSAAGSGDYTVSEWVATISATSTEAVVTVTAVDDSVDENAETLTLSFGDLPGGVTEGSQATTTVTLADDDTLSGAPGVATVSITSNPGPDGIYAVDEEIEVTVVFDKIVAVTGTPQLGLTMDSGPAHPAEYSAGAGEVLVFTYAVADGDSAASGFGIAADSLTLNGGTILDATDSGTNQAADLTHAAVAAASGHVVDGRRPALQSAGVDGFAVRLTYDETLDTTSTPAKTAFTVTADGAALSVESVALSGAVATLTLGAQAGSGQTVLLDYTPPGTSPLRDPVGNAAVALSGRAVTNTTPEAVYDEDADGLIAITTLAQLDAVRHDPDGDGVPTAAGATGYAAAFPDARRVVCGVVSGCAGYELLADLDFLDGNGDGQVDTADDANGDGRVDAEDTAYWNDGAGWAPIGAVESHEFRTTFEGHGHTIRHLFARRFGGRHVGLFGRMKPPGVVRHVGLTDAEVTGNRYVGGLVGTNAGVVTGSHVAGRVTGIGMDAGGLVGTNSGTIHASYATGRVAGGESAGGLVGRNSGTIRASYATGQVVGRSQHAQYIGSLVGRMTGGSILASYATGRTRTGSSHVGGLVGQRTGGSITDSYWDTSTSGHATGGGGAGKTTTDLQTPTGYTTGGIYEDWNVDLSGDSTADDPWHFGTTGQYPALKVDFNGDDEATWQEFGYQMRAGPSTPTATATAGQVALSWTAAAAGHWTPSPAVTYTVYRDTGTTAEVVAEDVGGTTYTDTVVAGGAAYAYQVAAVVGGGEAAWSGSQAVTTVNSTPVFANSEETRSVAEDAAAGTDVGAAVTATDADRGDTLSYSLEGTDAGSFDIVAESGQIRTKAGLALDHETKSSYSVTVKAEDGNGGSATVAVTITVTDADEQPQTPAAPTVAPTANTTDSLDVGWTAPGLNGGPALTGYEVQYRKETGASWTDSSHSAATTSTTIGSLEMHSIYEVQVRALNGETPSDWSPSGRGSPGNNLPVFDDGSAAARSVAENAAAATDVGAAVAATDADNDTLSYSLEGADAGSFDIVAGSGQIRTTSGVTYDHETRSSYSVAVKAVDANGSATVPVTIAVTDVDEPPAAPDAPAVGAAGTTDSLYVTWTAPDNTGPEITGYDVRYGVDGSGSWRGPDHAGTGLSATITGLAAATTYAVQVRATNAEGTGAWSVSRTGQPAAAASFVVSNFAESNPAGTAIQDAGQLATAFATGAHPGGYAIDSVSLQLVKSASHPANSTIAVTVRADSAGTPGRILITLAQPEGALDTVATTVAFTAPAASILAPETTYFLVAAADSGGASVLRTDSDVDVSAFGWSIADGSRYAATGADWADTTYSLSMEVEGGLVPPVLTRDSALVPSGLAVGDRFRLLFATSSTGGAASTDIDDYNGFVQTAAAAGHADVEAYSSLFTVVASTASVDARDNTGTTYTDDDKGVPVYWLGGGKAADDYEDFYDGDWDDEADARDESGSARSLSAEADWPFTGSDNDGTADATDSLGSSTVIVGKPDNSASGENPIESTTGADKTDSRPFYALSPVFVVVRASVSKGWSLTPEGLGVDDTFRLLFATSSTRNADSTAIADYNGFVQTAAAGGHVDIRAYSTVFSVVGSTAEVDARDNTGTTYTDDDKGVPIYWLDGSKVADDYEDFYDGGWDDEVNAKDESGAARDLSSAGTNPLTGSEHDGTEDVYPFSYALGAPFGHARLGRPNSDNSDHGPISSNISVGPTASRPFYALSSVFEVVAYAPEFRDGASAIRAVPENAAAGTDVGAPVSATDGDPGDTLELEYGLGGDHADSFTIMSTSGQIRTRSGVDYDHETQSSYAVDVSVTDGTATATIAVTITVTDVDEQPETPAAPTVTATAGTTDSLDVGWTTPGLNGGPALTGYELRYRKGRGSWTDRGHSATSTSTAIGSLDASSAYEVHVRALNGEAPSAWSPPGTGTTGTANRAPTFANSMESRSVAENSAAETDVGGPVAATDAEGDTLSYGLEGADAASFDIVSTSGQIRTKSGVTYDHETKDTYGVTVKADDGNGGSDTVAVTITVTDVAEQPATPSAPTVTATSGSTTSLDVGWTAPGLNGGPALTGYEVEYRKVPATVWTDRSHSGTGTSTTISGLDASSEYQVQVRALNGETPSGWSPHGSGTTGTPNAPPVFANATEARSVAENTAAAENVGAVVTATDTNVGDTLTYSLEGADAASFDIEGTSGQIQTKSALDHETQGSYSVTVKADDGNGGSDTVAVTITVTDVAEPPDAPDAPTVSATAGTTDSLDVSWMVPDNAGRPDITDYDVQYQAVGSGTWLDAGHTGTALSATLASLAAGTVYAVQVRATNDEGTGAWSDSGLASTDSPLTEVPANWALIPTGLTTSDTFRLLFLTATTHDPDSSDIADYNTYVQAQAAAGHADIQAYSAGFRVVGSTASVDARDNTATTGAGVPIHWLDGTKVADDYADFYDGSWDDEANPSARGGDMISPDRVWTGSGSDGTEKFTSGNLSRAFGATGNLVGTGRLDNSSAGPLDSDESFSPNTNYRYYALSSVFAVGSEVVNSAPEFANDTEARSVAENTAAAENVGAVVTATDTNVGDTLTYSLEGTDAASFDIEGTSGQIKTKSALDHETKGSYSVTVKADDGNGGSDTVAVTITVTDVAEQPSTPTAPSVTATSGSTTSLDVSWTAPGTNGGPALTGYEVEYRKVPATVWTAWTGTVTGTSATITPLDASSEYQVQVRALNGETPSGWSPHGSGTTGTPNSAPVFANATEARSVAENSAAETNVGAVVTATDANSDTLEYTLEGTDAASFSIVSTSGQIQTKAAVVLDHETKDTYAVTVKADDDNGGSDTVAVTITVTDVAEQPATPTAPSVTATANTTDSLDVGWTAPGTNGGPALTGYEVQYRKGISGTWTAWTHSGTGTTATIAPLDASSEYHVRVRALNGETPSDWSPHGTGTTGTPNSAPVFANATEARGVAENSAAETNVGAVVTATDANNDPLAYTLEGTDAASFTIVEASGQIQTKSGVTYDYETKDTYAVTVKADDGNGGSDTVAVTITVTDVAEQPTTPTAPSVTATSGSTTSLDVSWTAPGTNGGPALTGYEVEYRKVPATVWTAWTGTVTGTSATITPLDASSEYQVQVRALNGETPSGWSPHGSGTTGTPNSAPVFANATEARSVAENSAAETNVGAVVTATDANSDTLEYTLEGTDAASFSIVSTSGQIQTKAAVVLDHETKDTYAVTVKADDDNGGSDTVAVTITVTDVAEQPATPTAPSVTATANTTDSLDVGWTAPGTNGGPALTGYEVQYRKGISGTWTAWTHSGTGTTATIAPLDASSEYHVRVRALNGETPSDWSPHGTGTTGTPNSAPVFANATEARGVAENSAAETNVGAVVTATDANNDPLAYTLEGTDAASFTIVEASGQIQTKSGVTYDYETKDTYAVTVKADDGNGGSDTVAVTITVTDVAEQPTTPTAPTVAPTADTTDSLDVGWTAPGTNGGPALTGHEVQYRAGTSESWIAWPHSGTGTSATITALTAGTSYRVRVRALNGETPSAWSPSGTGTTGTPGLSIADSSASEGAGSMVFDVTLSQAESAQVTVAYATSGGSAIQGTDYTAASGTLTFAPGDTTESITVALSEDSLAEADETFQVTLSAPQNAPLVDATATGTITDNDQASTTITLSLNPDSVAEGGGARSITATATLDQSPRTVPTDVVVSLHSQEVEFGPGRDMDVVAPFTITIEPGRTSASHGFMFRPHDDALAEGTESIEVRGEAVGLRVEPATLELTDNDTATVNLGVPYKSRHSEGGGATHVTVEATLDTMRSAATVVTVEVRGSGRSGVSGFEAVAPFELTIPAGRRRNVEGGFMLYPENDDQAEADETLTISGRAAGLRVTGTTFLLEDDDSETASTTVTLELNETRLAESGGAHVDLTVTGTLDGAPRAEDTVVTLTPTNRKGDGSEVTALVDTGMRLTIRAGRISGRRTFGIVLNTPGIDQQDGVLTLGGTADGLTVEPATLELLDGDAPPDRITLTLSETRVPEGWRGTVRVLAEMTPSARTGDTVVTLTVTGSGADGAVAFRPVGDFDLTIPKAWEAYGAKFVLLTEVDAESGRDETLTVRGTTDVAGLEVLPATLTLVDGDATPALDFPYFANGDSATSEIVLLNPGPRPVRPAIHFSDPGGGPIAPASVLDLTRGLAVRDDGSLTFATAIAPMGMRTVATHGRGPLLSGSATVRADSAVAGVLRHRVPDLGSAAMAAAEPLRDALLAVRGRAAGGRTAVALHNVGPRATVVGCRLIDAGGVTLEQREIALPANGQTSWYVEDAFATPGTTGSPGLVRCTAPGDGLFTAAALRSDAGNGTFAALPALPVDHAGGDRGATVLSFAQFAAGAGTASELLLVNPSARPGGPSDAAVPASRPVVYFHDAEGNPIAPASVVELSGDLRVTDDGGLTPSTDMAPLAVRTISTHGQGELLSGSVRVVSDGPLGGFLRVGLPAGVGVAVVGANPPLNEAIFLARHQAGGSQHADRHSQPRIDHGPGALRPHAPGGAARHREFPSDGQRTGVRDDRRDVPRDRRAGLRGIDGALRRHGPVHGHGAGDGSSHRYLHHAPGPDGGRQGNAAVEMARAHRRRGQCGGWPRPVAPDGVAGADIRTRPARAPAAPSRAIGRAG